MNIGESGGEPLSIPKELIRKERMWMIPPDIS